MARAYRRNVEMEGEMLPPSRRAMADWVVPSRRASSACDRFASFLARINSSITAYSASYFAEPGLRSQLSLQIGDLGHGRTLFTFHALGSNESNSYATLR